MFSGTLSRLKAMTASPSTGQPSQTPQSSSGAQSAAPLLLDLGLGVDPDAPLVDPDIITAAIGDGADSLLSDLVPAMTSGANVAAEQKDPASPRPILNALLSTAANLTQRTSSLRGPAMPIPLNAATAASQGSAGLLIDISSQPDAQITDGRPSAEPLFSLADEEEEMEERLQRDRLSIGSLGSNSNSTTANNQSSWKPSTTDLLTGGTSPPSSLSISTTAAVVFDGVPLTSSEVVERLARLKKLDQKFPDVVKTLQAVTRKANLIDTVVKSTTPLSSGINTGRDLETLASFIRDSKARADAAIDENQKLNRRINELKEVQQLEAATKSDLFNNLHAKISSQQQEIKSLRSSVSSTPILQSGQVSQNDLFAGVDSSSSSVPPTATVDSPTTTPSHAPPSSDVLTLKLKIKELASALKTVTEQRNKAVSQVKELQQQKASSQQQPSNALTAISINSNQNSPASPTSPVAPPMQTPLLATPVTTTVTVDSTKLEAQAKEIVTLRRELIETRATLRRLTGAAVSPTTNTTTPNGEVSDATELELLELRESVSQLRAERDTLALKAKDGEAHALARVEAEERNAALETIVTDLRARVEIAGGGGVDSSEFVRVTSERDEALARMDKTEVRNVELVASLAEAEKARKEAFDRAVEAEKQAERRVAEVEEIRKEAESKVEKAFSVIRKSKGESDDLRAALKSAESIGASAIKEVETLKTELADVSLRLDTVKFELGKEKEAKEACVKALDEATAALKTSTTECDILTRKLSAVESQLSDVTIELTQLKEATTDPLGAVLSPVSSDRLIELESQIAALTVAHDSLRAERDALVSRVDVGGLESAMGRVLDLERLLSQRDADLATARIEIVRVKELDGRVAELLKDLDDARSELNIARDRLAIAESEAKSLPSNTANGDLDIINAELDDLRRERERLEEELEATKRHLPSSAPSEDMSQALKTLEADLAVAREEILQLKSTVSQENSDEMLLTMQAMATDLNNLREKSSSLTAENVNLQNTIAELKLLLATLSAEAESSKSTHIPIVSELESLHQRASSAETQLALTKAEVHVREERVGELERQIVELGKRVAEEEEKKTKSVQLLRNSKARILKLEENLRAKEAEVSKVVAELAEVRANAVAGVKEREAQMATLTRQVEDMAGRLRRQSVDLASESEVRRRKEGEVDGLDKMVRELLTDVEKLRGENAGLKNFVDERKEEVETSRGVIERLRAEVGAWPSRVAELEHRCGELESDLETSHRLFETRSAEAETLKLRVSELERGVYENEVAASAVTHEIEALRRECERLRKDVTERRNELRKKETEIGDARKERDDAIQSLNDTGIGLEKSKVEVERLIATISSLKDSNASLEQQLGVLEADVVKREESLRALLDTEKKTLEEKEKLVEEMRARESHLQKLNRALKDEVRKLSRAAGLGSPTSTPPVTSRNSVVEINDSVGGSTQSLNYHHRRESVVSRKESSTSLSSSMSIPPQSPTGTPYAGPSSPQQQPFTPLHRSSSPPTLATSAFEAPSSPAPYPSAMLPPRAASLITGTGTDSGRSSPMPPPSSLQSQSEDLDGANVEYLKNLVMKFVESRKEKRIQMIPALGMILRLSPDEIKRVKKHA